MTGNSAEAEVSGLQRSPARAVMGDAVSFHQTLLGLAGLQGVGLRFSPPGLEGFESLEFDASSTSTAPVQMASHHTVPTFLSARR